MRRLFIALTLTAVAFGATDLRADGTLKGTFKFDGTAPKPEKLVITKDQNFCGKFGLVDESLVVGKEGGIANVVVFIYVSRSGKKPPITDFYKKQEGTDVALDNNMCRFSPRVATLWTAQQLVLGNKDAVGHNSKIDTFTNTPINFQIPANTNLKHKFEKGERFPASPVSCASHPWMKSWLVIKDHPYMAVTDADGKFEIPHLPAGKWTFQFWHERSGFIDEVTVDGKSQEWARGRKDLTIQTGKTIELGEILVKGDVFNK